MDLLHSGTGPAVGTAPPWKKTKRVRRRNAPHPFRFHTAWTRTSGSRHPAIRFDVPPHTLCRVERITRMLHLHDSSRQKSPRFGPKHSTPIPATTSPQLSNGEIPDYNDPTSQRQHLLRTGSTSGCACEHKRSTDNTRSHSLQETPCLRSS